MIYPFEILCQLLVDKSDRLGMLGVSDFKSSNTYTKSANWRNSVAKILHNSASIKMNINNEINTYISLSFEQSFLQKVVLSGLHLPSFCYSPAILLPSYPSFATRSRFPTLASVPAHQTSRHVANDLSSLRHPARALMRRPGPGGEGWIGHL